ncbi:hypothetical protein PT974_07938 [Cladobotryum mycophilum]|uniref:Transcription factor hoxa13 n=1 Tax=Cladobotryum mycophilum TaxID=491253 RepID=A0ABR0SC49_9HYPO
MAAESIGSLKPTNGSSHVNGKMNGQTVTRKQPAKKRSGFLSKLFNIVARLTTWTVILTILFRCPSSLDACDETSPVICEQYFRAKNFVTPYAQPLYDQHVAPYVDFVKPYYDAADSHFLTPAREYAVQYGAPLAKHGQEQALQQWEKHGQPRVAELRARLQEQYGQFVAPHLTKATEAIEPYYEIGRTNSLQLFYEFLLPSYEFAQPYALQGYDTASTFATEQAVPAAYWIWNKTSAFLEKAVWPQMRVVYMENVEPQLVRIGERLERYKNKTRTRSKSKSKVLLQTTSTGTRKPSTEQPQSSFSKPEPQSTTYSSTSTVSDKKAPSGSPNIEKQTEAYWNPVKAPAPADNETEERKKAREMVAEDLEMWQNKFAAQADEGAVAMEEHIDEIAQRMVAEEVAVTGKGHLDRLKSTVKSELDGLKIKISTTISKGSNKDADDVEQQAVSAIRSAGMAVKQAAQAIRGWREQYDEELQQMVLDAADVHFQILDETRGLALQQIGMKWAWTDGVTYKDWAKYHELKKTLSEWTEELKKLIVTNPALLAAQEASAQVEDNGMTIASAAARELARLKEVTRWKIAAKDATDNFDSVAMRLAAEAARKASQAPETATHGHEEVEPSIAEDLSSAAEAIKLASPAVVESEKPDSTLPVASDLVREASSSTTDVKGLDVDDEKDQSVLTPEPEVQRIQNDVFGSPDEAQSHLGNLNDEVAESDDLSTSPNPLNEESKEPATKETSVKQPSESLIPTDKNDAVNDEFEDQDQRDDTPVVNVPSVKPAFLGAAAQVVADRQIVLDEDEDTDDLLSSATNAAEAAYSSAVSLASGQYSSAASIISAQIYGTPEPVHNQLFASISSAYDKAVAAASSKLSDAADAASSGVLGTPTATQATPTPVDWARVESIAAQRLNEGKLWAELQYQSALIAMGLATPTPTSPTEKYYEEAKYHYYARIGLAQDRYSSFIAAASSAWSSVTATPTPTNIAGSASSMASAASKSAVSVANVAGEAVESAYSAATENVASAVSAVDESLNAVVDGAAEQVYLAGVGIAEKWETVVGELSAQIYGQPTPTAWLDGFTKGASASAATATSAVGGVLQTASADAARHYEDVSALLSELIVGREAPFTESVFSRLSAAYATAVENVGSLASEATAAAESAGSKASSVVSQATEAAKEKLQPVRDEL